MLSFEGILDLLRKYLPCSLHSRLFYTPQYLNKNCVIRSLDRLREHQRSLGRYVCHHVIMACIGCNFTFDYLNRKQENRGI